jgi:hypothetical protein
MGNVNDGSLYLSKNAYYDGSWRYKSANSAMNYIQDGSGHAWMIAASGAATGNVITWTQAMTLDTAGRLGIGTSNPASPLSFGSSKGINSLAGVPTLRMYDDGTYSYGIASGANGLELSSNYSLGDMRFFTGGSTAAPVERIRIDNTGNLLVGETSGGSHVIAKNVTVNNGSPILQVYKAGTGIPAAVFFAVGGYAANSANSAIKVGNDGVTSRSISAGGTINASGADYAEYMTKADDCGVIAKGQIVGVNADGKLTDKWADAVSFLIKSTDPSYVGGDVWGTTAALGRERPEEPVLAFPEYTGRTHPGEAPVEPNAPELPEPVEPQAPTADADEEALAAYTAAHDQYLLDAANYDQVRAEYEAQLIAWHEADQLYQTALGLYELDWSAHQAQQQALKDEFDTVTCPAYEAALAAFDAKLEEARQRVDRIAYCGQVPVNVSGATPGQYVVPAQNGTGIKGILVDPAEMTLAQYMAAVGVVQNILPDGRANVRVKVV